MTLLATLAKLRAPASHAELTEKLVHTNLDRVTIYRNLLSLHEAGLLVRTQLGDNIWRYELPRTETQQHGGHPHFVCTDCSSVMCLEKGAVSIRGNATKNQVAEVQLRGRCSSCVRV